MAAFESIGNGAPKSHVEPGDAWNPGFALPGRYYWDPQQFEVDLRQVFFRNWLFAGNAGQIPRRGDFFVFTIGRDSLIIVRGEQGEIHAHFNSCRHRGSQICDTESGHASKFVCPYHSWVYGIDGQLETCRLMNDEIDKSEYPLHAAHVEVVDGFIFVCLARQAPDFTPARDTLGRFFAPHRPEEIKGCLQLDYSIRANWKTIIDNNRECYHCAVGHREFCFSNFDFGMPGDPRSSNEFVTAYDRMHKKWKSLNMAAEPVSFPDGQWFRCMRFPLKSGFLTESLDGQPVGPIIGDFPDHDIGSLRIVGLPNMWFHLNSDYVMTTRLVPVSPTETHAKVCWYVHPDAKPGIDFDPHRVADVWRITSEQDWKLCELNQVGMQSTRYVPGPLSQVAEQGVTHFIGWYLNQLGRRPDTSNLEFDKAEEVWPLAITE